MAAPRTFISFDFDNNEGQKIYFMGQCLNSRTPFNVQDWSSKAPLAQAKWETEIEDKIGRCHLMIVLVGRQMGTATGVQKEIQMAIRKRVPFFGIYVDQAGPFSVLPAGLPRNRVIEWNWNKIAAAIEQMMREGKNKV